jgi:hypothetical protein
VHLKCGVRTNVITAVEIGDEHSGDSKQLPQLLKTTAKFFPFVRYRRTLPMEARRT